jgi:hypothetical protein
VNHQDQLEAALAELASGCETADDVARKLAGAGCQGYRSNCYECPIVKWLLARLPGPRLNVIVSQFTAEATWESAETCADPGVLPEYDEEATADLPDVLRAFLMAFDAETADTVYPELDPAGSR